MLRLERLTEVCVRTGVPRARIYELVAAGEFPRPRKIGKRAVGWRSDEIDRWIQSRPEGGSWKEGAI